MDRTVCFRDFEERDIDFIYKCKNDENLNSMIVGDYHPFTYDEASKWVRGCIGQHDTYKFWAICTNDDEKRIVGWVSLSNIDIHNKSACHHGIVIGEKEYKSGISMFEAMLFTMAYSFEYLQLHRLYGSCFSNHKVSPFMLESLGFKLEGIEKEAVIRGGDYFDVSNYAILSEQYFKNKAEGNYDIENLIVKFISLVNNKKIKRK